MITTEPTVGSQSEPVLLLPGVVCTRMCLTVFDAATDQQLHRAFSQITKMEKSVAWWLGDLGIAIQERKRRLLAREAAELRQMANDCTKDSEGIKAARGLNERAGRLEVSGVVEYTAEVCAAHNVDAGYLRNCVSLSRFYQPSQRCDGLTVHHHRVAFLEGGQTSTGAGEINKAVGWLNISREENLSVSELRKRMRMSGRTAFPPTTAPQSNEYKELDAADSWCIHNPIGVIDSARAQTLCVRWLALREWVGKLEEYSKC